MNNKRLRPRLHYILFCDDVRQEIGGKFSLMGLFESIESGTYPALHPRFAIISEWGSGQGEFTLTIRLLAPDKEFILSESEASIVLYSESQRHRDISIQHNTTFKVPGTYWIEMLIDGERVGMAPLRLLTAGNHLIH